MLKTECLRVECILYVVELSERVRNCSYNWHGISVKKGKTFTTLPVHTILSSDTSGGFHEHKIPDKETTVKGIHMVT